MQILLARHGESQANLTHQISNRGLVHGLTPTGREQAAALAERLVDRRIHRIYTSPLLRALETTILVSRQLGIEYEVRDALREFDCGRAEGRSDHQAWLDWQSVVDDWTVRGLWARRIEGGESFNDLRMRFIPFLSGLVHQFERTGETILCVSHGGLYRMMLPQVLCNLDDASIREHGGFEYTTWITAEPRQGQLACTEWNGESLSG
jgi:broad specificity phosphatase PhoE